MKLSKLHLPRTKTIFIFISSFLFVSLIYPQTLYARGPTPPPESAPYISCSPTSESEFHSLRPYQSNPCNQKAEDLATFCGNDLIVSDKVEGTYYPGKAGCVLQSNNKVKCTYSIPKTKSIAVKLSDAYLPILGNTENVKNFSKSEDELEFDDPTKVNEYVSWYLSGVPYKREYAVPNATDKNQDTDFLNYSGPISKLLPQEIQNAERIKTIERAVGKDLNEDGETPPQDRHDQIVVCSKNTGTLGWLSWLKLGPSVPVPFPCPDNQTERLSDWNKDLSFWNSTVNGIVDVVNYFASLFPPDIIPQDIIEKSIGDHWNKRIPPLSWDPKFKDNPVLYKKAYLEWRGKTCVILPIVNTLVCLENILVPNKYADLFSYVPLSSTEDRKGEVEIQTSSISINSADVEITNVKVKNSVPADLFFAHTEESKELAQLLQKTFTAKDNPETGDSSTPFVPVGCNLTNIRTNPGDNLFAGEARADVSYDAKFSCEFDPPGSPINSICNSRDLGARCYPYIYSCGISYGQVGCPSGYRCGRSCYYPTQTCEKQVNVNFSVVTKSPVLDEIWSRLVAGPSAIFKRIFPKVDKSGAVKIIYDIPGAVSVTYNTGDGNTPAELYFPHLGGMYEYFLKGIQTMLRPKGYGEQINTGPSDNPISPPITPGRCSPGTGPCSVENLLPYYEYSNVKATKASIICNKESGSDPDALNNLCLFGRSRDFSVGLFQINMLAHPDGPGLVPESLRQEFRKAGLNPDTTTCPQAFTGPYNPCTVVNQQLLNICTAWFREPQNNIEYSTIISRGGTYWRPWSAAAVCGIY